jgi:DNA polymerase-1
MPVLSKTAKGQPSTAEAVLDELAEQATLPEVLMQYRSLSKLKSTYTDKLPEQINPRTGRIHLLPAGGGGHRAAVVQRPEPAEHPDPHRRRPPHPPGVHRQPGYKLLAADYSQIELRIMAHLAKDEGLLHAFRNDLDVHRATAAEVFGVPWKTSPPTSAAAKAINFGLIYGMSAFGLAKQIGVDRKQSRPTSTATSPATPACWPTWSAPAPRPPSRASSKPVRAPPVPAGHQLQEPGPAQGAERTAINAPMQGTAADIIKRAMVAVDNWLRTAGWTPGDPAGARRTGAGGARGPGEAGQREDSRAHERGGELDVPLLVEVGVGSNWDEAH